MQATRVARFNITQITMGGRQPYGLRPSATRKRNQKSNLERIQHTHYILKKYNKPKKSSGIETKPYPYYPEEIIPVGGETVQKTVNKE